MDLQGLPARLKLTPMTGDEIYLLRLAGAVGGAIIAPALIPPGTWFPLRRTLVGVLSGFLLGGAWQWYFAWPNEPDLISGASCIISTCSWWAWHAVIKALDAWNVSIPWFGQKKSRE